jgi:DNA-binding NtrC family response regulator
MNFDASGAVRRDSLSSTNDASSNAPSTSTDVFDTVGLIGRTPVMLALREAIRRFARSTATTLVRGETGSGKELVARALHAASPRARNPFVAINVATLRSDLAASELFGHERGGYTGAVTRRRGAFELAHNGTLFLDEIGDLDLRVQADLLRVLEAKEVRAVGSESVRRVDVHVVAATNRDLAAMVASGHFRADLFFRLNVLGLTTPPLRERRADVPLLVNHLLHRLRPEVGERRLTADALALLVRFAWPGNVRQLANVVQRVVVADERRVIDAESIASALAAEPGTLAPVRYQAPARDLSAPAVAEAMHTSGGSIAGAARHLGVARSTLRERVRVYRAAVEPQVPVRASPPSEAP